MYSVLYPETNLGRYLGMVPETLRISSEDISGRCDEDPIPSIFECRKWYDSIFSAQNLLEKDCKALEKICRLSTCQFHSTFLGFPKSVRMRSLDGSGTESKSVIVITICL